MFIFLHVLPNGFKDFAMQYMETHDFVNATMSMDAATGDDGEPSLMDLDDVGFDDDES